ncbi:hypothetical protein EVAR_77535_1 [Eumeta japonica]|uniref:Uncharacterized protein n=1 Tax=Eumeta variegata TaxID=151549 RepID=A0A4C1T7E7_EUMVA|nr:hypothetical protein EVAR_77535_1 [Eumeta japonica]
MRTAEGGVRCCEEEWVTGTSTHWTKEQWKLLPDVRTLGERNISLFERAYCRVCYSLYKSPINYSLSKNAQDFPLPSCVTKGPTRADVIGHVTASTSRKRRPYSAAAPDAALFPAPFPDRHLREWARLPEAVEFRRFVYY